MISAPVPDKKQSFDSWIDSLESKKILALLCLWDDKTNLDELTEILDCLKDKFKVSTTVNNYYNTSIEKELEKEKEIFDNNIIVTNRTQNKRYRYNSSCGRSQCEFRTNGCNHSP